MVELRWLPRKVETLLFSTTPPMYGEKGRKGFRTEMVLQYRTAILWRTFDDVVSMDMREHGPTNILEWSGWRDIPTAKED